MCRVPGAPSLCLQHVCTPLSHTLGMSGLACIWSCPYVCLYLLLCCCRSVWTCLSPVCPSVFWGLTSSPNLNSGLQHGLSKTLHDSTRPCLPHLYPGPRLTLLSHLTFPGPAAKYVATPHTHTPHLNPESQKQNTSVSVAAVNSWKRIN